MDSPDSSVWAREEEESEPEGALKMLCCWLEGEGRGHKPRHAGDLSELERQRNDSPLEPQEGAWPCPHPDLNPVRFILYLGILE